jgi:rubredoxin
MKRAFLSLAAAGLTALAQQGQFNIYQVRCPSCLADQVLWASTVRTNGGYATNYNGVTGAMQQMTASFHCKACHWDFTAPTPDRFVPVFPATPVASLLPYRTTNIWEDSPVWKVEGAPVVVSPVLLSVALTNNAYNVVFTHPNALSFQIQVASTNSTNIYPVTYTATQNPFVWTIHYFESDSPLYWSVRALRGNKTSAWSNVIDP